MRFFRPRGNRPGGQQTASTRPRMKSAPFVRPRVEPFEDRCVPAVFPVTSALDDVGQHGTLRYALAHAADGDTILLTPAVGAAGITLTQGELLLTQRDLTIASASTPNPVAISGGGNSRVFEVASGASVTIADVAVTGGDARTGNPLDPHEGRGGGVVVDEGAALTLTGCAVTGNVADRGGGIADFGALTMSGCTVSGNQALVLLQPTSHYGGGISVFSGAPFSPPFTATLTIADSTVSDNTALENGGGIAAVSSAVTVDHCVVTGNTATKFDGGGLNNHLGAMTVCHSQVDNNSANWNGGGLFNDASSTLTVTDCDIDGNSSTGGGGVDNLATLVLQDSRLTNNFTRSVGILAFDGGGAMNWFGATAAMHNDVLTGNVASAFGGGVYSFGALAMSDCVLSDNSAIAGGAVAADSGTLDVRRSVFDHNSASFAGGAIECGCSATVSGSSIHNNTAGQGGGVDTEGGSLTMETSEINNNSSPYGGGGIFVDYGTVVLSRCTVSGNSTAGDGGGILDWDTLTLTDCTVTGNTAGDAGGGVFNYWTLSADACTVSGNTAAEGGGIANFGGTMTVSNSAFLANAPDGLLNVLGGVYVDGGGNTGL